MIRVRILGAAHNGTFPYRVEGWPVEGRSREPLLDACRELERMGVATRRQIGLFWPGTEEWALRTTVGHGARLTVREDRTCFERFKAFG